MALSEQYMGSFRDPSGFVYRREGVLYRQINRVYRDNYERMMDSGLHRVLVERELLVPHTEVDLEYAATSDAYRVIRPEPIPFVSYPYEWSHSQLKDAALLTLEIQSLALAHGFSLKDASAYNIQFVGARPVFIDTLSFEAYQEGVPWVAYRQFCQHFLAPLALMAHRDVRLGQLLRVYIDGIPLDLAHRLLPPKSRLSWPLLLHIHAHSRAQRGYADKEIGDSLSQRRLSRAGMLGLIDSLRSGIEHLRWRAGNTVWSDYYADTNYVQESVQCKEQLVGELLSRVQPRVVWDLGANTGRYSRLASNRGSYVVAFDSDPGAVERNYQICKAEASERLLPLMIDLTNPSPAIGWSNSERLSLGQRSGADVVMVLALIHHLVIGNNVPLAQVARFLGDLGPWLIIEFVPKDDSQVKRLLANRDDIFSDYTQAGFESTFADVYDVAVKTPIRSSERTLYLMRRR